MTTPSLIKAVLSCLALSAVVSAQPAQSLRTTGAVRTPQPVALDGLLAEPAWATCEWQGQFTIAGNRGDNSRAHQPVSVQTRFKVLYDDYAIYVGVECDEPALGKLKARTPWRDGAVWQDDCVEIFFDPGNEGRYYHQVMVNSRGTIYDSYSADYGLVHSKLWNGAFRAAGKVDVEAGKWRVELEIPLGAIVLGETAGASWKWNVTRERHAGGTLELSTWSPMTGGFHKPRYFGTLAGLSVDFRPFRFRLGEPRVEISRAASGITTLTTTLPMRNETGTARRVLAEAWVLDTPSATVTTGVTDAADGAELELVFPPFTTRSSAAAANVVFALRDAGGKRILKAAVKNLSTEYKPLSVTLLRPCYRNSIYATESLDRIVFTVQLSAQVRQAATELRCELTDSRGGRVSSVRVPLSALNSPASLAADALSEGEYSLDVSAWSGDGAKQAESRTLVRKLPPPPGGNEVRIDENRNLLVNGEPFLAIGWYGSVPTDDPRADVVALQNVQTPTVVMPPDTSSIRKAFEQHGIYSIASVENGRLFFSFKLWQADKSELGKRIKQELHERSEPSAELMGLVRQLVECVRGEPGLLGYYIADEPEIHDVPSAYLENFYKLLCELDPYHPVFVTNDTIDGLVTHGYKCADVLDPDPYSSEWDYVPNFMKKINEVWRPGQTAWVTLWHSSGQAHFTGEYGTVPPYPYEVMRNQYFASVCYGATGFTPYTSPFFMPEIEHRYGLPHIWRELRLLEPAIVAADSATPIEGDPRLALWAREAAGRVYVIAVNHKAEAYRASLRWPRLRGTSELHVLSEGRSVAVRDSVIEDRFEAGAVHIYTDDARAPSLPTTSAIRRELDERAASAVKPGNLLHWTRGTKVRCSEGYYAPWFHQYFYYAINGITDDKGWHAYAWGGKPTWMELTLKRPADIGRVVLHTPNLKDYQLDLVAAGGTTHRVTVSGNRETVVTHRFQPAVPALKLRLTATAVDPDAALGGGAPMVQEIEAYADAGEGAVTPVEVILPEAANVRPLFGGDDGDAVLWREDFSDFQAAPKYYWKGEDTRWVVDSSTFRVRPLPDKRVAVASVSPKGYAQMSHIFPYDPACRFFQVKLDSVDSKPRQYRFTHVGVAHSSGKKGYRGAVNTCRPGIYTVDTHYIHDDFRLGTNERCFVTVGSAGSSTRPDGGADAGPEFTFDWLQLARTPVDGLVVTLADGSPLGDVLRAGDVLHFELHLLKPAQDAVVDVLVNHTYQPLPINGDPSVQLRRAEGTGRLWTAEVTLGLGTGRFRPKGYPAVFRASITGGAIDETYASASVAFEVE